MEFNCKNCDHELNAEMKFCHSCGAKVITKRMSFGALIAELVQSVFGWDNKYFVTFKTLLLRPEKILVEFLGGVRKRYMNPFGFMMLGLAVSLFMLQLFDELFIEMNVNASKATNEFLYGDKLTKESIEQAERFQKTWMEYQLKYYNYIALAMIPMFSLVAFWVYRKPYNYGEHLIINCFLQGVSFIFFAIVFLLSLIISPHLYILTSFVSIVFFAYAYSRLYKHQLGIALLKVIMFLGIFGIIFFSLVVLIILTTFILD